MSRSIGLSIATVAGALALAGQPPFVSVSRGGPPKPPAPRNGSSGVVHRAQAARSVLLTETGHLHLTSRYNFTLNEKGSAVGTVNGAIYVHLTAVSSIRVVAEVNIYPRGGSISGKGTAAYRRTGTTASFSGSMSIGRGSGRYAHVHGSRLRFSGTIAESNGDAIVVRVSGRVSY
jgi:hypothetical protein